MFDWMKKHQQAVIISAIITIFVLIFLVPFVINLLFKLKSNGIFSAEWSAGDFLQYYGSLLTFASTVILSLLVLWQNKTIRDETEKRTELAAEMEIIKNMPKFSCKSNVSNGYVSKLRFTVTNVSENVANDFLVCNIKIIDEQEETFWSTTTEYRLDALLGDKEFMIELNNPALEKDGLSFCFNIKCKDKFNYERVYDVIGKCEKRNTHPRFKVIEKR
jgi:uncharacterized membrane protein